MAEGKLKTAVLGLNKEGLSLLEAAGRSGYFQIQAVADPDSKLQQQICRKYNCPGYDDYRQLIVQNELDVLFVAAPTHTCAEHIRAAMKKHFNILKLNPLARNFDEAAQFVKTAKEHRIKFAVANLHRFNPARSRLQEYLRQIPPEHIYLITVLCCRPEPPEHDWHRDPKLAGGGVLLQGCYEIFDEIILNFSCPQKVYSLNLSQAPDKKQRQYLTEDTAVLNMQFTDRLIANVIASTAFGPAQKILKIYAKDKILTLTDDGLAVCNRLGEAVEQFKVPTGRDALMSALLESFAKSLISSKNNPLVSSAEENLSNMALLEAAYLSARTGMPEEPARILEMAYKQPTNIWPT